ncbi:MAG TPA: DUF1501 domain-containing protein [Cyclobacteriaceae bacterium]|nr:DUF1501 domain-containing protein [Cyclobacteriaceae bacterium]
MERISRRKFVQRSALATAGTMMIPQFLKALENPFAEGDKILVVLQLSGGNDGLNTIIPFRNDIYFQSRPKIAVKPEKMLKVSDELGFNGALEKLRSIYDQGFMSVINNVGYPNPDRSHFRSMDIWQSASVKEYLNTGWIGRYLDANCNGAEHNAVEIDDSLSLALKGDAIKSMALKDPAKLYKATHHPMFKTMAENQPGAHADPMVSYLYKTAAETVSSAAYIYHQTKTYSTTSVYPNSDLGNRLKTIGTLINSGVNTRVYYAALSGFDTHVNQNGQQERLLTQYAEAVAALVQDLDTHRNLDRTMIMTFSEFGRRVSENASGGTDHGTANNVFIFGKKLKQAGFFNGTPDLKSLDEGDLIYQVDFRSIYATLIEKWLSADSSMILNEKFPLLNFV